MDLASYLREHDGDRWTEPAVVPEGREFRFIPPHVEEPGGASFPPLRIGCRKGLPFRPPPYKGRGGLSPPREAVRYYD